MKDVLREGAASVLELVFPRRCFSCGLRTDGPNPLCRICEDSLTAFQGPLCYACGSNGVLSAAPPAARDCALAEHAVFRVSAGFLMRGAGADLIHALKYSGATSLAPYIAARMLPALRDRAHSPPDLVVPVPLHRKRLRDRGYNQSLLLAEELAAAIGALAAPRLLVRVRATKAQARLPNSSRPANVRGAFAAPNPSALIGKTVLLVDDVATTGATLEVCARVLVQCGVQHVSAVVGALS